MLHVYIQIFDVTSTVQNFLGTKRGVFRIFFLFFLCGFLVHPTNCMLNCPQLHQTVRRPHSDKTTIILALMESYRLTVRRTTV